MKQFRKPFRHLCIAAVLCSSLPFLSPAQAFPSRAQYVAAQSAASRQQAANPAAALHQGALEYMAMFGHFAPYW